MFVGGSILVVASVALLAGATAHSLDGVVKRAVQSLHENMGGDTLLLRDIFQLNHENQLVGKSRPKRIIELPKGLIFELKWNIDIPFQSFVRWESMWQFAALIDALYPAEFLQETKKPTLAEIMPPDFKPLINDIFTDGNDLDDRRRQDWYDQRWKETVISRKKRAARSEREAVYSLLESLLERSGLPARACMLRAVCEVAEAPFEQALLGDVLNTLFRPSKGAESSTGDEYDEFLLAEHHGHRNGSCHMQYGQCPESIFDRIPFFRHETFY